MAINDGDRWCEVHPSDMEDATRRIQMAIEIGLFYGSFDGDHHKTWTIDQMIRILAGNDYDRVIAEHCEGEDGPHTYEHDVGIAP